MDKTRGHSEKQEVKVSVTGMKAGGVGHQGVNGGKIGVQMKPGGKQLSLARGRWPQLWLVTTISSSRVVRQRPKRRGLQSTGEVKK